MTPHCGMTSEVALLKEGGNCTHHYRCGSKYLRRTTSKLVFLLRRTHVPKSRSQRVTGEARKKHTEYFETSFGYKSARERTRRAHGALPCLDTKLYGPSNNDRQYLAKKHDPWRNLHIVSQFKVRREHHCWVE